MKNLQILLCFLFSFTLIGSHLQGQAWGFTCGGVNPTLPQGNFYEFDLSNGSSTLLGARDGCFDNTIFAGEWINNVFYVINNIDKGLYTVDASGSCNPAVAITGLEAGHTISGLSHDISTDITYVLSTNGTLSTLYTLNINTGIATIVGNLGANSPLAITLVIDGNSNAYILDVGTDAIHPVNLSTGLAGTGVPLSDGINPINLNFAQDSDFDCDENTGQLYGMLYGGGGDTRLGTLDPATGIFTQVAFIGTEICAFSINTYVPPIPTLSQWGLIILALIILTLGVVALRYKEFFLGSKANFSY